MSDTTIKSTLLALCQDKIAQRMATIQSVLDSIEESRNNETKSSAGDKYETGRAMMQMEEDKNKTQLLQAVRAKQILGIIDPDKTSLQAELGSLVITSNLKYFISIGLGKLILDADTIYAISPESPIGRVLIGKKAGETLSFNKQQITILELL